MAEQAGRDLILKVLEEVGAMRAEMRERFSAIDERFSTMDERLSAQADTLMLLAANIQRQTTATKVRIDDHEHRLVAVERSGR
jgi:hypothetical protein